MDWDSERVALLTSLWADGLSASQIAKRLGNVTRNSVIGKVHRLGLPKRASTMRTTPRRVERTERRVAVRAAYANPRVADEQITAITPLRFADGSRATVLTLREGMCKFPIGDPSVVEFSFCGRPACVGPYCAGHARIAYQPPRR